MNGFCHGCRFGWGESTRALNGFATNERMWTRAGIWSTDFVADASRGREWMSVLGRESPRGREAGQWRGDLGQRAVSRTLRADGDGCPLWEGESTREGVIVQF